MANKPLLALALAFLPAGILLPQAPIRYDSGTISGLPARNIGSAEMSNGSYRRRHGYKR